MIYVTSLLCTTWVTRIWLTVDSDELANNLDMTGRNISNHSGKVTLVTKLFL